MAHAKKYTPDVAMVAVQAGNAGLNILPKLTLDSGMSPYVMNACCQIIGTLALAPFAFFLEWKACFSLIGVDPDDRCFKLSNPTHVPFISCHMSIDSRWQLKSTWKPTH